MAGLQLSFSNITTTSFKATVSGMQGNYAYGRTLGWYLDNRHKGYTYTYANSGTTSSSFVFNNLSPGTEYDVRVNIDRTGGPNLAVLYGSLKTNSLPKPDKAGTLTIQSRTATSVTVYLPSVKNADYYVVSYRPSSTSSANTIRTSSSRCTISNLNPFTEYVINYRGVNNSGDGANGTSVYFTTNPSNWAWTSSELNAFNNKGPVNALTYERWNEFIDRVGNFVWQCYSPSNAQAIQNKLNDAYMTSSDRNLTAARFNAARSVIGAMRSTGINDVRPGDIVYGSYFITLSSALNNIK